MKYLQISALALVTLNAACTVQVLEAPRGETATPVNSESPALVQARQKVRDVTFQIGRAESELRQLSPAIRYTDAKGVTTLDAEKQRQYENNRDRIDRQIRGLKDERLTWELRINQLVLQEGLLNRSK
jgi:hypothetical protein